MRRVTGYYSIGLGILLIVSGLIDREPSVFFPLADESFQPIEVHHPEPPITSAGFYASQERARLARAYAALRRRAETRSRDTRAPDPLPAAPPQAELEDEMPREFPPAPVAEEEPIPEPPAPIVSEPLPAPAVAPRKPVIDHTYGISWFEPFTTEAWVFTAFETETGTEADEEDDPYPPAPSVEASPKGLFPV